MTLSTHVLDTARGTPAAGVKVRLLHGDEVLASTATNADGRCPDLPAIAPGKYRLEFAAGAYFRDSGVTLGDPPFLDVIGIDFGVAGDSGHYHVPLLVSPYSYSTYRGS